MRPNYSESLVWPKDARVPAPGLNKCMNEITYGRRQSNICMNEIMYGRRQSNIFMNKITYGRREIRWTDCLRGLHAQFLQ